MSLSGMKEFPRLPLDGNLDLTYRCNNTCRHCWLWLSADSPRAWEELSFAEIQRIVAEARRLGCQAWSISGGEPMLRADFVEIFDYITRQSKPYSLNTNGTLITPGIARLLTRKGKKMVALYGATAEVHDRVTRSPGSFEAAMRGFAYLKEAGAGFIVQIIPMRDNYHQYEKMLELAASLSPYARVGAPWLWLSACGSTTRNRAILEQRLDPAAAIALDPPEPACQGMQALTSEETGSKSSRCGLKGDDDRLFASCIASRRDFHVDPYGGMTFCCYIKDPALRYDLRRGTFRQAWEEFIPSLAGLVRGGQEYTENCGSCDLRRDCRWCGVYGYLEHGRFSAKVDYLCRVAGEARRFTQDWKVNHLRYYQIAGITIQVSADFPITDTTFDSKFRQFQVEGPGQNTIAIRLATTLPPRSELKLGQEVYRKAPWAIYRQPRSWVYLGGIAPDNPDREPNSVAIFTLDHTRGTICRNAEAYEKGGLGSLTTFPSDQILLARILADRQGCYVHASGMLLDGKGLLFVGHSEAGKSTTMKLLRGYGEILCDDRIIIRRWPEGFRIHGTWSHGELPDVSSASAPLHAILFIEKASSNVLIPITDRHARLGELLSFVIKPLVTADWWEKTLDLAGSIAAEVPAYRMRFDKSRQIVDLLRKL
jgi:MoaA/NifB/PqqE/SkfB family radical SAM enzyme